MAFQFKLIAGLGNKDLEQVSSLVLLWMRAGADIFDIAPSLLLDIENVCKNAGFNLADYDFCTSVPIRGDIHGKKAKIDYSICKKCGKCAKQCPQNAISFGAQPVIDEKKCIGCAHCKKSCPKAAISLYDDINDDFYNLLNKDVKIDTVEVHISIKDKKTIVNEFKKILNALKSRQNTKISVCFNRKYFSNNKTEKILKKLKEISGNRKFIVQADGNSMNAGQNSLAGTLEAVAFGLYVKSLGYEVILSGGCNSYTAKLAADAGLKCSIGYGTFARKLTEGQNSLEALNTAKNFVLKTKELLND